MDFPLIDRSNYLKGLLITARKDKQLTETETIMIKKLASRLGFSSDFFEETISNLLENKYITEEPIKFSSQAFEFSWVYPRNTDGKKRFSRKNLFRKSKTNYFGFNDAGI